MSVLSRRDLRFMKRALPEVDREFIQLKQSQATSEVVAMVCSRYVCKKVEPNDIDSSMSPIILFERVGDYQPGFLMVMGPALADCIVGKIYEVSIQSVTTTES